MSSPERLALTPPTNPSKAPKPSQGRRKPPDLNEKPWSPPLRRINSNEQIPTGSRNLLIKHANSINGLRDMVTNEADEFLSRQYIHIIEKWYPPWVDEVVQDAWEIDGPFYRHHWRNVGPGLWLL